MKPHYLAAAILVLVLAAAVYFFWPASSASKPPPKTSSVRIGFLLATLREERWQKDRDLFVAAAGKQGAFVETMSCNSDPVLQIQQAENLISQGMNVLVVVPQDGQSASRIVELAHADNVKVVAYDRMIGNSDLDFYVSFDNVKVGEMEAQAILNAVPKGTYAYIGGSPTDNNATLLRKGSMAILDPAIKRGDVKVVVDKFMTDWRPDEAYAEIKRYLTTGGRLDAVVAANDGTADGTIRALREFKLDGKVPVSGQDAELAAVQRLVKGTQAITVYKPISTIAGKAADVAVALARGTQPASNGTVNNGKIDVPSYLLDPVAVTKATIDTTVIRDGYHTKEQVYGK